MLVLVDPTLGNLMQRHGIKVMKLFASMPENDHQVRPFLQSEVFCHSLPGHV